MEQQAAELLTGLKQQIILSHELLKRLQQEKSALAQGSPDEIEQAATHKSQASMDIENQQQQIAALFNEPQGNYIEHFTTHYDGDNKELLQQAWKDLGAILKQCQHQNAVNSKIIYVSHQNTQHVINLLFGQEKQQNLYGPDGKDQSLNTSQGHSQV